MNVTLTCSTPERPEPHVLTFTAVSDVRVILPGQEAEPCVRIHHHAKVVERFRYDTVIDVLVSE